VLIRYADSIYKVVKVANNTKLSKKSKLLLRSSSSKLLFLFTNSVFIYYYLYNKVNNIASVAYTI
jgi:hypothetical protein